jgi:hypothetical protein
VNVLHEVLIPNPLINWSFCWPKLALTSVQSMASELSNEYICFSAPQAGHLLVIVDDKDTPFKNIDSSASRAVKGYNYSYNDSPMDPGNYKASQLAHV